MFHQEVYLMWLVYLIFLFCICKTLKQFFYSLFLTILFNIVVFILIMILFGHDCDNDGDENHVCQHKKKSTKNTIRTSF
jgi:hypothetical protein